MSAPYFTIEFSYALSALSIRGSRRIKWGWDGIGSIAGNGTSMDKDE